MPLRPLPALAGAALLVSALAAPAAAQFAGRTVGFNVEFQASVVDPITVLFPGTLTATVSPLAGVVEFPNAVTGANADVDFVDLVGASRIRVTFPVSGAAFAGGLAFNGFRFFDVAGVLPAFASAELSASSTTGGLYPGRLEFDADNILLHLGGISTEATFIDVDVTFAPPAVVPEPGTWALLGAGLLALGGAAARRRRA